MHLAVAVHLGRHVAQRARLGLQRGGLHAEARGEPKVGDLDLARIPGEEDVHWLHVAMHDAKGVVEEGEAGGHAAGDAVLQLRRDGSHPLLARVQEGAEGTLHQLEHEAWPPPIDEARAKGRDEARVVEVGGELRLGEQLANQEGVRAVIVRLRPEDLCRELAPVGQAAPIDVRVEAVPE